MSTNTSQNLGLHLWEPTDQVLRTEFNENWQKLDTAVEALHDDDLPAAHQAILKGVALCKEMRQGSVLYLRTEDFLELEASLRAAASHLTEDAQEEALGELGRAAFLAESVDWLTRRWL